MVVVRYTTKSHLSIIGRLSKLFSHFVNDHNPCYVLYYSDNDFFSCDSFQHLGFRLRSLSDSCLDYCWRNNELYLTRQQCISCELLHKFTEHLYIEIYESKEKSIMEYL